MNQWPQHCLLENPTPDEEVHEGPRGYAHALAHGTTFVVLGSRGDMNASPGSEQGLYHDGVRFLSRLAVRICGHKPILLHASTSKSNIDHVTHLLTPELELDGQRLGRGTISIRRSSCVWESSYYERFELVSYADTQVRLPIEFGLAADFRDLFEIRGIPRQSRGSLLSPSNSEHILRLNYQGLDDCQRTTTVSWSPRPETIGPDGATLLVELPPRELRYVELRIACRQDHTSDSISTFATASEQLRKRREHQAERAASVTMSNELYNRWFERSAADLWMMSSNEPWRGYPLAGLPWFTTVFGRDGIITALETLWWNPDLAASVLRCLARLQADELDPSRDAEPGKILHELRDGEMAALGEVPFARYYGSIDATPLFVVLAGAYYQHTGDRELIDSIWPNLERALQWIERHGDCDGDGFVEYNPSTTGLLHQGWKDSADAIVHADGRAALGSIALCEAQAYAFAARRVGAQLARLQGLEQRAAQLEADAERLRRAFESEFWDDDIGCYVLALAGDKQPCRVVTSNAGHALLGGICSADRARQVAAAMVGPDMYSGWGVRTLSKLAAAYNPASYHRGSVWPHDTALIAMGMSRYGLTGRAAQIFRSTKEASVRLELHRLPELFCGFDRRDGFGPTPYPSACAPQSWSAGAAFAMLSASLGLEIDAETRRIVFRHPSLPDDLDEIEIRNLRIGDSRTDLAIYRHKDRVAVSSSRIDRHTEVVVIP